MTLDYDLQYFKCSLKIIGLLYWMCIHYHFKYLSGLHCKFSDCISMVACWICQSDACDFRCQLFIICIYVYNFIIRWIYLWLDLKPLDNEQRHTRIFFRPMSKQINRVECTRNSAKTFIYPKKVLDNAFALFIKISKISD